VQVEQLAGRRSQGRRISQQLLDLRPQSSDRTLVKVACRRHTDVSAALASL
jgi:hypothetical protein